MAYAALLSLSQILEQTLNHVQYQYPLLFEKEKLVPLQENVSIMLTFLENHSRNEAVKLLERRVIDATYRAEDIIESQISSIHINSSQLFSSNSRFQGVDLFTVLKETDSILKEMVEIENNIEVSIPSLDCPNSASLSTLTLNDTNTVVGLDDDFMVIKNRMYRKSYDFKIIPIVGMGGIGKSTLARRIYEDSIRAHHFDRHVWIVMSQEYSYKELLLGVLRSILKTDEDLSKKSEGELEELIHKELFGRRYLIVLDDVWTTKACDEFNRIFPKDANGSCMLLTTRLLDIATYVASASSPQHTMHPLSEEQSWNLLKKRVFGERCFPSQLERIGKEIAKLCRGLPLTIVVVAGLLKGNMTKEYWESISRNLDEREPTILLHCSKVLSLSYDHLPLHLKPCFLYVTAFPEDTEINVNRLVRLWMAEGFVRPNGSKCLEEVAEEYLNDLVGRSLLLVSKKRYDGRIKTIRIHDVLRDVGIVKAQEESFHYHDLVGTMKGKQRRLSIHTDKCLECLLDDIHDNPMTRSLMIFCSKKNNRLSHSTRLSQTRKFRLLRILDAISLPYSVKPEKFVHLRHLALRYDQCEFSNSMSKLQNLQTFIVYGVISYPDPLCIPLEIWKMPSIRHLILPERCCLEQPPENEVIEETNLQTLTIVASLEINRQTTKMLANVRKLGLFYCVHEQRDWEKPLLSNLVHLEKLEELKIIIAFTGNVHCKPETVSLAFPPSLKKLSLFNFLLPNWDDMNIILGSLPYLEVLKLRGSVSRRKVWTPIEDQLLKLKYLELERVPLRVWEVESSHFPSLEILYLVTQLSLKEIPSSIGDIDTLKLIELFYCDPPLVASARKIRAEQRELGNEDLQVIVRNVTA